jgi:hypothetical protein
MRYFKSLFITSILIVGFSATVSSQIYYGGGMSFNSNANYKALGLTAKLGVPVSEKFDLNGNVTYYLASQASFAFDADVHYKLFNLDDRVLLNPFGGINFTRTDITNNSLSLGISLKVIAEDYTYYFEPRWILDNKQIVITIGVLL